MIAMIGLIEAEPGARLNGICMFRLWGFGVLAVVYSLSLKLSAARAALDFTGADNRETNYHFLPSATRRWAYTCAAVIISRFPTAKTPSP